MSTKGICKSGKVIWATAYYCSIPHGNIHSIQVTSSIGWQHLTLPPQLAATNTMSYNNIHSQSPQESNKSVIKEREIGKAEA